MPELWYLRLGAREKIACHEMCTNYSAREVSHRNHSKPDEILKHAKSNDVRKNSSSSKTKYFRRANE
jgi:DNA phosphorothioation-dependent restriction protein DptG